MFRKEANQQQRLYGVVSLAQPVSIHLIIIIITICIVFSLLFLSQSDYARKETVRGYLVPTSGVIKVYSNREANLDTLFVKEGDTVQKGDVLAKLVLSRAQSSGEELSEQILDSLKIQLSLLVEEASHTELLAQKDMQRFSQNVIDYRESQDIVQRQIRLLEQQLEIQNKELSRFSSLLLKGHISEVEFHSKQQSQLLASQDLEVANASAKTLETQYHEATSLLASLPHQTQLKLTDIQRRQTDIARQIEEAQNSYEFTITAREAGTVTAIAAKEGEFLLPNRPLMSLMPKDAELIAELLLPSRSAGFLQLDDEARLRFDAFPYQRFGFIAAKISHIDKALISPGEADMPIQPDEAVYRIQATLESHSIQAYGEAFPLKAGMQIEADLILDTRSLLEWLLDPLYSLKGRVG
ncbi:HlyD family secretion protein [Shewanella halifaxensis]|uniref:HlyD family secretion protein n=1 Tax=Shewanella halifaxensis TaxID=271098 RepID=UPI000D591889|nr:HlyD family efflux transporter periplasmic adaptor subunit [Shewanella halifaxensis]